MRAPIRAPVAIGIAVFRLMMSKYSSGPRVTSPMWRFWRISPSAKPAATRAVMSTMSSSNFPPIRNALVNMKSPVTRASWIPNFRYAAGRPRRSIPPSLMSSWIKLALWMSSSAAAMSTTLPTDFPPTLLNARRVTRGRTRLPPDAMTYSAISVRSGSSEARDSRIRCSTRFNSRETPKSGAVVIPVTLISSYGSALFNCLVREAHGRRIEQAGAANAPPNQRGFDSRGAGRDPRGDMCDVNSPSLHGLADRRRYRAQVRVDHVVAVSDPLRHHHDGDHDRDEGIEEGIVTELPRREGEGPPGKFRGPLRMLLVVPNREVRVVALKRGNGEEFILPHRDEGEVRNPAPEILVHADEVVESGDHEVEVIPRPQGRLDLVRGHGLREEADVDQVVVCRTGERLGDPLVPSQVRIRRAQARRDPAELGDVQRRMLLEHRQGLPEDEAVVDALQLIEQVLSVRRLQVEPIERGGDVRHQVEHAELFLIQIEGQVLPERIDVEPGIDHRCETVVVEVLGLDEVVSARVDQIVEESRLTVVEDFRNHCQAAVFRGHPVHVSLCDHCRARSEPQRLTVVPDVFRLLPHSVRRQPGRTKAQGGPADRLADAPELIGDPADVVLQRVLRKAEVVVIKEALRISAEAKDELR